MNQRTHRAVVRAALLASAMLVCGLLLAPGAGAALSASEYEVGALCSAPHPGHAGCLGLRLLAKRPLAVRGARAPAARRAGGGSGRPARSSTPAAAVPAVEYQEPWNGSLSPQNLLTAYSLASVPAPATQQTLALVDAYNDPTVIHDLEVFDAKFALPPCTTVNGCFTKVEMQGGSPASGPPTNAGWAQEIATDVEVAHGLCPSCHILLVEAYSSSYNDLEAAEAEAESRGASEISNSWGGAEFGETPAQEQHGPFNHPGTVITASSGDDGYLGWDGGENSVEYPASSPHVVAVGGTRLTLGAGGAWSSEKVWNGLGASGGGCSTIFEAPPWQLSVAGFPAVGCGSKRAVADVSADADPYTGAAVYDSTPVEENGTERSGWVTMGGTSVASPIIAATFALAGGAGKEAGGETVKYPAQTLYENLASAPGSLHDVVSGSNGKCSKHFKGAGESGCSTAEEEASCLPKLICAATTGYDGPSGVGTPDGIAAFEPTLSEPGGKGGGSGSPGAEEAAKETSKATGGEGSEAPSGPSGGAAGGSATGAETSAAVASVSGSLSGSSPLAPALSGLSLTHNAIVALRRHRPAVSRVSFAFLITTAARVRVTLAKLVGVRGRGRWQLQGSSLTITATRGRNSRHLSGRNALAAGRYRLTLAPAHGAARSLTFQVR
jgi:hypothetical protein